MAELCRKVVISGDKLSKIPYFSEVYPGFSTDGIRVSFSIPTKCVLVPSTIVEFSDVTEVEAVEGERNIVLVEKKKKPRRYVFPKKLYRDFSKLYVEPLKRGEAPFSSGVVFAGAPGTGKTTLAKLTARVLGIPTYSIAPTILSKWVGESEQRLRDVIDEALRTKPSIIILDDAEWILNPRNLADSDAGHTSLVWINLHNILFDAMQDITNREEPVLFIATTNVKLSEIDEAFRRYGRFGETLLFPLPDYEALYTVLRDYVDEPTAVRLAKMAVNAGLSTADAIGLAMRIRYGVEPEIKERVGRGYRRVHVEHIPDFEKVFKYFPKETFEKRSRLWLPLQEDMALAVATQILYSAGKTVMYIVDPRHVVEAVHLANITGSGIIISSALDDQILDYVHKNANTPVIYVGETPPRLSPFYPLYGLDALKQIVGTKPLVHAVAKMHDVEVSDDLMRKIENKATDTRALKAILSTIVSLGTINEAILADIDKKQWV
mgnify:CR=1 FL=1